MWKGSWVSSERESLGYKGSLNSFISGQFSGYLFSLMPIILLCPSPSYSSQDPSLWYVHTHLSQNEPQS